MSTIEKFAWDSFPDDVQNINTEKLNENASFSKISLSQIIIIPMSNENILKINCNDENHTIVNCDTPFFSGISIDKNYFISNKQTAINKIVQLISKNTSENLSINDIELIVPEVLIAIADNPNIKRIRLGNDENKHTLTEEVYELFKNSNKDEIITESVDKSLEENFDFIIDYNRRKKLIGNYNYEYLQTSANIKLDELSDEEMQYLKFINKDATIEFKHNNVENIFKVIEFLENNNQPNKIVIVAQNIEYNYKNELNSYILTHPNVLSYNNIEVELSFYDKYSINDYINYEKRLIEMIRPALNLSPFEKYLYAYDIVKKYKEYEESEDDKDESRDLYKLLDNEYMVCVGYSKLLKDLLNKLGINSSEYDVTVDVGLDKVKNEDIVLGEDILTEGEGHARLMVSLKDPKYNLDGIYIADPTWDNDLENDSYCYALMTIEEYIGMRRYNYINRFNVDEVFFSKSVEEFYIKANKVMDFENGSSKFKDISILELQINFILKYLDFLKPLHPEFVEQINNKYPNFYDTSLMTEEKSIKIKNVIVNIMYELAEFTISKNNNLVAGDKFEDAIRVLYEQIGFTEDDVQRTMKYNKERYEKDFPKRIKYFKDGTYEIEMNEYNKFDKNNEKSRKMI